ncbi:hypothetical protein ABU614_05865 [Lysobacter firmicutimachus]|uniref:DUF3168 domain-containing protein n=1 Tax=Lysobacter firmicutimachus TaxID=1792846 RepID=A0AAU8MT69_9GAMM|nr:hypothetical protein [Lysobacter antibioticus]
MPYQIFQWTGDPLQIPERYWASAQAVPPNGGPLIDTVRFTPFTSCIGILASSGEGEDTQIVGIHLSLMDTNDNWFDNGAVAQVMAVLQNYPDNRWIVGQTTIWEDTPTVSAAYQNLVNQIGEADYLSGDDGIYSGALNQVDELEGRYIAA